MEEGRRVTTTTTTVAAAVAERVVPQRPFAPRSGGRRMISAAAEGDEEEEGARLPEEQSFEQLRKANILAEKVVLCKQRLVELSRLHSSNRETLGEFQRRRLRGDAVDSGHWLAVSNMFLRVKKGVAEEHLKELQEEIEREIAEIRRQRKRATRELLLVNTAVEALVPEIRFLLRDVADDERREAKEICSDDST